MRGQVTIEYILILVIMLVILATVSLPTVDQIEADVTDVGNAVNLASVQQRIVSTANEMSLTGCGSTKAITVHIQQDVFTPGRIKWNKTHVWGYFMQLDGEEKTLKSARYPTNIHIDNKTRTGDYWEMQIDKNCTGAIPTGCIGMGC